MELTLSEAEKKLISELRAKNSAENAAEDFKRRAIETAHKFEQWSIETDEGLTFSTFINTFGYQHSDGKQMYEAVKRIQQAAWPQ